ncbi:unnamed protein product [Zymoseptoria tritici ST99CH_1A5]|uniref:Xylanolytic transcriptional activator regulatory domain-containing protein n=1 Tax=Zymoseptoria tritici ST99CH_1A5 TaxID=1276529 RepID=A0A1Y6LEN1_ZYMTR|nr:unnamed protein product [Zymoseptoria tritici ST99CH_1A5]
MIPPLIDIYFRRIHPVLPILSESEFRQSHAEGMANETLVHAICNAAAKDAEAASHLRLTDSPGPLAPREFCSRLHTTVKAALKIPAQFEKLTLIRILALASLHAEGQDGGEEATLYLVQALHYGQTLALHLAQQAGLPSGEERSSKLLFWCLWSLDRLYSCIYGRPVMMSDVDLSIEPYSPGESGFPAFEVWLSICKTLNKLIGFYRPHLDMSILGWEEDFPSFEDAIDEGHGWDLPEDQVATLHLFYLLVGVLTHRSRGVRHIRRSSASYVRQSLCTLEIKRLMASDLFSQLLPLPLLPYAISLALSVSYQHLRQSHLTHQQVDARDDFRECYQILHKLRRTWASADIIASISKKVLDELNKATDLAAFRISRIAPTGAESPGYCTASLARPDTLIDGRTAEARVVPADGGEDGSVPGQATQDDGVALFSGMDDLFTAYLDPNYPINLDDFSFMDNSDASNCLRAHKAFLAGQIQFHLIPQGSFAEKIRCSGVGIPGFYSRTGLNTLYAEGKLPTRYDSNGKAIPFNKTPEVKSFKGKDYLLEEAFDIADFAWVKAWKTDKTGNCIFGGTSFNFSRIVAPAARITFFEAEEILEVSDLAPESIHLPGLHVNRLFKGEASGKIQFLRNEGDDDQAQDCEKTVRNIIAQHAGKEFPPGSSCNLGVGMPTLAARYAIKDGRHVYVQSKSRILGVGGNPKKGKGRCDWIDASNESIVPIPGASTFGSDISFGQIRG